MIIGLDIESQGTSLKFVCGSLAYKKYGAKKRKVESFIDRKKFENRLIELAEQEKYKRKRNVFVYAHNTQFDFFRFADLENKNYIEGKQEGYRIICSSRIFLAEYLDKEGKVLMSFYDTGNLLRMPLADAGKELGFEKKKLPEEIEKKLFDENYKKGYTIEEMNTIIEYNQRDAEVCLELVLRLKEMMSKEGYKPQRLITAGQIAMSLFNKKLGDYGLRGCFMQLQVKDIGGKPSYKNYYDYIITKYPKEIHDAYRGGLIIANQYGDFEDCYNIDVNSLFPYCSSIMPVADLGSEWYEKNPLENYSIEDITNTIGVSNCKIECPKNEYGYLPIRYKTKRKIGIEEDDYFIADENIYPNWKCELNGTWTNLELANAIGKGYKIKELNWSILYNSADTNPFKYYVEEMYEKRKANPINKWFYKICLNSIHGKMAQKVDLYDYRIDDIGMTNKLEMEGYKKGVRIGYNYLFEKKIGEKLGRNYAPILSSYITAKAREVMLEHMEKIPSKDLLYVANDALLFKGEKYLEKFKIGEELGEFKIVERDGEQIKGMKAQIWGKNNYKVGNDYRVSGVNKKFIIQDEIKNGVIKYERFTPLNKVSNLKDLKNKQKLSKDLIDIRQKSIGLNELLRDEKIFNDKGKMVEEL